MVNSGKPPEGRALSISQHFTEAAALKVTVSGAGVSTASGLFGRLSENGAEIASIGVIVGIIVGLAGLTTQIVMHLRRDRREKTRDRREQVEHEARMRKMNGTSR